MKIDRISLNKRRKEMKTVFTLLIGLIFIACNASKNIYSLKKGEDLQTVIDNLPDGETLTFEPAVVNLEKPIFINGRKNLTLDFNGLKIESNTLGKDVNVNELPKNFRHKWPRKRSHFVILNSQNISIKNLSIRGPHKDGGRGDNAYKSWLEGQHAFEILNSDMVSIDGCSASYIYGDGYYIGDNSKNIKIINSSVNNNGRQGVAVTDGQNILIDNCEFNEIRRAHIDLEGNTKTDTMSNITITNNYFGTKRLMWIAAAGKGYVGNVIVKDNYLDCGANIYLGNYKNKIPQGPYHFENNESHRIHGNPHKGIWRLIGVNGFTAINNNILAQKGRGMSLIAEHRSENVTLKNNIVVNGSARSIPRHGK